MKYNIKKIKSISKFSILDFGNDKIEDNYINLSNFFWESIFDKNKLEAFFLMNNTVSNNHFKFIVGNINNVKSNINFFSNNSCPKVEDIFFSYNIFGLILDYYNSYYDSSNLFLSLSEGIIFNEDLDSLEYYFEILSKLKNNVFVNDIIVPIINNNISLNNKDVLKISIFWPNELILVGVISNLLKENNPDLKIIIDFSSGNEQFDFTQWVPFIKNENRFFDVFDFFIINSDFGKGANDILEYLNDGNILLDNIIYKKGSNIIYNDKNLGSLNQNNLDSFISSNFNKKNLFSFLGKKTIFARFLPYKCYWNRCSFCAINSGNQFSYDNNIGYEFFIDKWIKFIEDNDVVSITFMDEAIPPKVIIAFANRVKINNKFTFQFRTRFDKLYSLNNCKILYNAGARFCGIGLESAVDRVNEGIGNKGDIGMTINDKCRQIHYFDSVGIPFHNYSIMGFPGETDKEAYITYNFLKINILRSKFVTCTPNIFSLMKGPEIFKNRKKLGIEIEESDINNPFNLSFNFKFKGKERNVRLLNEFSKDLHRNQFLPWLDNNTHIDIQGFWNYIDRSYIFYVLKRSNSENPFNIYNDINRDILDKNFYFKLSLNYNVSKYMEIIKYNNFEYAYDWVSCKEVIINSSFKELLVSYDSNISLTNNLDKINMNSIDNGSVELFINSLLKAKILLKKD